MESPTFKWIANLSQKGQRTRVNAFGIAKYAFLLLCLSASISLAASDSSVLPSLAPINPEFTGWQSKAATFNLELRDAEGHTLGLIPSPIDRSHLLTQTRVLPAQLEGLPPSYDLRTYGYVTPVKNQGSCGSCWAFGSYGPLESWLLKNAAETWDFSENHLKNYHGFDWGPCEGGNADISTAYLARWSGPVSEADDPYHDYDDRPSPGGPCRKYLEGVLWFFTASDIKNALMTYGGMYVEMYMDSAYYKSSEYTYYYNGSNSGNHAVTLVGWDDSKVVTGAPGNGAWLIKNSWGTGWGDNGYFWISYYDSVAVKYSAAFCDAVSTESYATNYQYDPLGWTTSVGYGTTTAWAANIFTATANEQLTAVGLYAGADATSYIIYVYDNFNGSTFSNLLGSVSGTLSNSGYHTIPLASPINLTTGNAFSIVVKFTTPGYTYPIPVEMDIAGYSSGATASPGQSYVSSTGTTFTDLTTSYSHTNVCIRGLTVICPPPAQATNPNPANLATNVGVTTDLSWTAGSCATSHDVYFGTTSPGTFRGNQAGTTFDTGTMSAGTTYYWRIDEKNAAGTTTGDVWSFTTTSQPSVGIIGSWLTGTTHTKESGTNRALVFIAHAEDKDDPSIDVNSVSYGGRPMTQIIERVVGTTSNSRAYVAAFILNDSDVNAASGNTFTVTWNQTPASAGYSSVFLKNVNQSTLIGASASNGVTNTGTISTSALSTSNGDMVLDAATSSSPGSYTPNNGFTEALEVTLGTTADGCGGYKAATGAAETPSVTHSDSTNVRHVLIGFVVKVAEAPSATHTLTTSATTGGTVTTPGIGTYWYDHGTNANIVASASTNYHFVNWTGTAVNAGKVAEPNSVTTTVLMDANYTVQANFAIDQRTLTVSTTAGGTVTTPGIGTYWYIHGTDANIVATANLNYHFVNWTGDTNTIADSNAAVTTITMDANYAIQANFSINQYPVTATSGPNGSIDPQGTIIVNYGDNLCFTAAPNTCYEVNEWYLDGNNVQTGGNYCLNSITANHTVYVTFKTPAFTVTASSDANGSVQPSSVVVNCGASQDFNAIPNPGYQVAEWFVDGNSVQAGGITYTLPSVTADHTVYVTFGRIPFTVNASADANGGIGPTGEVTVYYGDDKQFTATANPGYQAAEWFVDGNSVQNSGATYTLEDVTADHTVYVTFKELIFVISGYVLEQDGNTPVEGVPIQTDGNDVNTVTDANGFYELWVDYNWSGIVTPQKEGYVFKPDSNTYANVTQDYGDENYIATLMTFKIAGYVLEQNYATPINDVNVSAENGGGPWTSRYGGGSWLTDANGYYEVVVDYNWSGVVTSTKYAYAFDEPNIVYTNVLADQNEQDYIGRLLTFAISGYIRNECNAPIEGVLVDANAGGGESLTDVNGFYEVWVDYNWSGTITPSRAYYTFTPSNPAYSNVLADQTEQNYQAINIYDLDCDGSIGFGDLRIISENLLDGPNLPGDFYKDEDDIVNFLDFAEFAKHWLEGPIL